MEFSKFTFIFLPSLFTTLVSAEPQVEIVELFGNVLLQIGKPAPIKCEVEEGVEGGELKWKVGATYLDTPSSPTQDDDYVDIITHELEFVPKKEYNKKSLACEYWVSGQRYSDAISLDLFSLEVITGPSVSPAVVEEGGRASLSLVASIFPAPGPDTEVAWTVEDSGARELVRLAPGERSRDGQYKAGDIQAVDSVEDAYLLSLDIATVGKEEMSKTHKLTLKSSAKKTVTFELAMRERANTGNDPIEPSQKVLGLNTSVIIIIIIVLVLVIVISICCFMYRKKTKESEAKEKTQYVSVNQADTTEKGEQV